MSSKTKYFMASSSKDYGRCNAFLRSNKIKYDRLSFPTIFADRDGDIVGVISTLPRKDMIVAGPLFAKTEGNQSFIILRLLESYERVLNAAGVSVYNWAPSNEKILSIIRRVRQAEEITPQFFRRTISGNESRSTEANG